MYIWRRSPGGFTLYLPFTLELPLIFVGCGAVIIKTGSRSDSLEKWGSRIYFFLNVEDNLFNKKNSDPEAYKMQLRNTYVFHTDY